MNHDTGRKPAWLKFPLASVKAGGRIRGLTQLRGLVTVCEEARCPNRGTCAELGAATFMILGNRCTRNCRFCAVGHSENPAPPDPSEPLRVAMAARDLKLDHAVITSVTRDDLSDGGAGHFAETVREVARLCPEASVEVLVPDFQGNAKSVETVLRAGPDVFNHNLETVKRLYGALRPGASYERSLNLLERARGIAPNIVAKSGIMVGAGETVDELKELFDDLSGRGLHILTIGQYLRPTPLHHEVDRYLEPEEFDFLKSLAKGAGIPSVVSGPLVRSSFKAKEAMDSITPNGHEHI